jgi:hypothetical protein
MSSEYTLSIRDYSRELSPAKFTGPVPVQSGFDTWVGLMTSLKAAVAAITLGEVAKETRSSYVEILSQDAPTDANAQRERKWLVTYRTNTAEKLFRMEIPTAKVVGNLLPASDEADLTATDMAAFVTAFEAFQRSPDDPTETVTVISIRNVGRNI